MMIAPGNIDPFNRPIVHNEDGTVSTTLSFSVEIDGAEVLLPMIVNGKRLTPQEAKAHYFATGEHLGIFDTAEEADKHANQLHAAQEEYLRSQASEEGVSKQATRA